MSPEELQGLSTRLADIQPPQPPDWSAVYIGAALLFILTTLAFAVRYRKRKQPQQDNSRAHQHALKKLQASWQAGHYDDRQTAYQLAAIARRAAVVKKLSNETAKTLDQLRYQASPQIRLTEQVFSDMRRNLEPQAPEQTC